MSYIKHFIFALLGTFLIVPHASAQARFYGTPFQFTWSVDRSRNMTLQSDMGYFDSSGADWPVKAPFTTDGASIPRVAWSLIGGPFDGPYRDAAIVHDFYCVQRTKPWRAVHRMFYDASIAAGTDEFTAKVMYAAVYFAGPRWGELGGKTRGPGATRPQAQQRATLNRLKGRISSENPSLQEIDAWIDQGSL